MNTSILNIGTSKGIILPTRILAQCCIEENVSVAVKNKQIIINAAPAGKRKGWARAFKKMAENGDDALVTLDVFSSETITR